MSDEIVGPPIKKRRPKASEQEKAEWAEGYYQSGLTQKQFAQEHGLADSTLQRWVTESQRSSRRAAEPVEAGLVPAFAEVKLVGSTGGPQWAAELCWPSGMSLRVAADLPAGLLEQLLGAC
jgi:hypothetical protein